MHARNTDFNLYLEKIKKITSIMRIFRDEPKIGILGHNRIILRDLQNAVQECDTHGDKIDQILQDKVLTQQEYSILIKNITKIDEITREIKQRDESNRVIVNELIQLVKHLDLCIEEVSYVVDVTLSSSFSEHFNVSRNCGYILVEEDFQLSLLLLGDLVIKAETDEGQEITQHKMKSDIEGILINLARWAGMAEKHLIPNVFYRYEPSLFKKLVVLKDALHRALSPYLHLLNNGYYRQILQSAKMGLEELSSYEEFRSGEDMKIKGLFRAKKGVTELELLKNIIRTD